MKGSRDCFVRLKGGPLGPDLHHVVRGTSILIRAIFAERDIEFTKKCLNIIQEIFLILPEKKSKQSQEKGQL